MLLLLLLRLAALALGLACLRIALFLLRCVRARAAYAASKVPGPPAAAHPLGHVTMLSGGKGPWALAALANEHGPLYKLQLLDTLNFVLTDPAVINRIVRRTGPGPYLPKPREIYAAIETATQPQRPNILTSADKAQWKAVRQGAAPCFSNANLRKVLPLVLSLTQRVAERMATAASDGAEFDVADGAKRITSDVMGQLLLGEDLGGTQWQPSEYLDIFVPVLKAQAATINNPWHLQQLWKGEVRFQRRCLARHNELMTEKVARLLAQPPADYTIAAHLLAVTDPDTGKPLASAQLKAEISTFMAAGFETTSHAITWCLAALAAHPDVQERVVRELAAAGLAAGGGGAPREFEAGDMGQLPLLAAVIKEALRLMPPAPWGGTKQVPSDGVELCGFDVPKGAYVMIPLLALSLSRANYGDDALLFKPERWLDSAAGSVSGGGGPAMRSPSPPPSPSDGAPAGTERSSGGGGASPAPNGPPDALSFLAGPRDCIGQNLARLELFVVLSTLLSRLRFSPGAKLQRELELAAATGQPPVAALHALGAAHITLQPEDGQMLLRVDARG